jgi:pimeloyl-ACP methyl ester carboxylesterase
MSDQEEQIMIKKGRVKVNDINMYYEIHGEGFPLVMIQGLGVPALLWTPIFLDEVSKSFNIIIFDNRGAGRTDKPDIEYSIKMFADDTIGLMDALNIERAHVLGFSMGGHIAQELVLNYPKRIEKLVLCSTDCGGSNYVPMSPEVRQMILGDLEGLEWEDMLRRLARVGFTEDFVEDNSDLIEGLITRLLKTPTPLYSFERQYLAVHEYSSAERLKKINTPTLVVHGKKDVFVPPQNSEILAELISGAKLIFFENSAHAFYIDEPEKFAKILLEFLK